MAVRISAVVCTLNRAEYLRKAIRSLVRQSLPKEQYEIIVVDNGSKDDTRSVVLQEFSHIPNLRYLYEPRLGLSHARNTGWQNARGEYVAYIDDDAVADSRWLEGILAGFEKVNPQPISVGGRCIPWYKFGKPAWFRDEYEIRSWGEEPAYLQPPYSRGSFSGSNMSWQVSVLEELGGFSPLLGMHGAQTLLAEETYLYRKAAEKLGKDALLFYDPRIVVYHLVPRLKMTIAYRWERAYAGGTALARMSFLEGRDRRELSRALVRFPYRAVKHSAGVFWDVLLRGKRWQRALSERGGTICRQLGLVAEAVRLTSVKNGQREP